MQGYVARHVGDHAGFHYYEWILMRIVDYFSPPPLNGGAPLLAHLLAGRTATTLDGEGSVALPPPPPLPQAVLDVWRGAWARSTQLLDTYGEHETIWQHRRFMAGALLVLRFDGSRRSDPGSSRAPRRHSGRARLGERSLAGGCFRADRAGRLSFSSR